MSSTASITASPASSRTGLGSVRHLPVNLFAAVMGLAGLSMAWRLVQHQYGFGGALGEGAGWLAVMLFVVLALGYLTKALLHPQVARAEFDHPIAGNFFGTIAISILLLSAVLRPYGQTLAEVVWTLGCVVTLGLGYHVFGRLLRGKSDAAHAVPAWLIAGVAALDIPVTGGHMTMAWAPELQLFAAAVGGMLGLLMFTMIGTRLIHHEPLSGPMVPSLMILVAPFEVGFLAYVNLVGGVDRFAALLFYFGLFMFVVLAPKVFLRGLKFGPTWWAIGFPVAALVNAALKYAAVHPSWPLQLVAGALVIFLTVALAVLLVRTLHLLLSGRLLSA
ncbi:SLAC1 anion channel family protein [Burkholderiaceae bacterium UC74_6]